MPTLGSKSDESVGAATLPIAIPTTPAIILNKNAFKHKLPHYCRVAKAYRFERANLFGSFLDRVEHDK